MFSLVEPDGSPWFGSLKAHDIAALHVQAELVVRAIRGAGEDLSGEGIKGLSYSFLRAGATATTRLRAASRIRRNQLVVKSGVIVGTAVELGVRRPILD